MIKLIISKLGFFLKGYKMRFCFGLHQYYVVINNISVYYDYAIRTIIYKNIGLTFNCFNGNVVNILMNIYIRNKYGKTIKILNRNMYFNQINDDSKYSYNF